MDSSGSSEYEEGSERIDNTEFTGNASPKSQRQHPSHKKGSSHKKNSSPADPDSSSSESPAIAEVRRDFDEALRRAVPSRGRKRGLDEETELDSQAAHLIDRMQTAASQDSYCISNQKVATQKISILPEVLEKLSRRDLIDYLLDNRILDAIRLWLEPYPDGSLPSIDVRKSILHILAQLPIEKIHLKESGLGKVVMYLYKSPDETRENKKLAYKLIDKWSRPIIGHSLNYKDLSRVMSAPSQRDLSDSRLHFIVPQSKEIDQSGAYSKQSHPYKSLLVNMEKLKQKTSRK
ncbi:Transcription factor iws1 [Mitosporidium daphniae]